MLFFSLVAPDIIVSRAYYVTYLCSWQISDDDDDDDDHVTSIFVQ